MISEFIQVSFLMMKAKPVRSFLSLLGIFIGVFSLVVILSIREGMRRQLSESYGLKGVRAIFVHPGFDTVSKRIGKIGPDDMARLRRVRGVKAVWPRLTTEMEFRSPTTGIRAHALGIDDQFVSIYRVPMVRGRTFLADEVTRRKPVCLLTVDTARKLFPMTEPLGAKVEAQGKHFEVIGVVQWTMETQQRAGTVECDILIPNTWIVEDASNFVSMVEVRLDPQITSEQGIQMVTETLTHGDPTRESLYFVRSLDQMVERRKEVDNRLMMGLLGIAGVSLLVGAIGVANVMITSVTERTREVGIRKALGARRRDILLQFLVESSLLCATGGGGAVLFGALAIQVSTVFFTLPFPVQLPVPELGFCVLMTLGIGLLAGVYPASRAAAMPPVDALRYE